MCEANVNEITRELENAYARIKELEKTSEELVSVKDALRESEYRYKALFEYTGTAMIVVDDDTTVLMGNHRLEEITGFSPDEIRKGIKWTDVVVPDEVEKMLAFHNKRRTDPLNVVSEYEIRLVDSKGNLRDMLANIVMIPGSRKSLVSLVDITTLKRVERALRESERKYRNLFKNANDIIFTIDMEGNFTSANLAALKTFNYSTSELETLTIWDLVDRSYYDIVKNNLEEKIWKNRQAHTYEVLAKTHDGLPVWVEVSTRLIRECDRSIGIQGIARDITERKRNQEQLEESQFRFKEIADLLPGIICEFDMGFNLTYVNDMGFRTFGFTKDGFSQGINVLSFVPPHMVTKVQTDLYNIFHGDYGNPVVYELYRKDKSTLHALINAAPIMKGEEPVGIRSCIIDISETVEVEEKLRMSEARFRTIYDESPIGIALFSTEGIVVDKNNSFTAMFSDIMPDIHVFNIFTTVKFTDEDVELIKKEECVNSEVAFDSVPSGDEKKYFSWSVNPIRLGDTESLMFLAQVQDITERKLAQEQRIAQERQATAKAEALVADLRRELREMFSFNNMVSRSPEMKQIFELLPEVARTSATALITGESGTGKEVVARSLHELSERKNKPFIAINCSALPDTLLESELFGYKAGAFTDAKRDKPGKFALAENGTLFLDEIGDISTAMQVKLLRVLQEKVYEPLGGTVTVKSNARILAATNKDIQEMVKNGQFREDLFYRINIVTVKLPPLRERRCDIPLLIDHFVERFNQRYSKSIQGIDEDALFLLLGYDFPGNIRELENVIEHAFIFCKTTHIEIQHLPAQLRSTAQCEHFMTLSKIKNFDELERMYIQSILVETEGNKALAARRLGVHKATLFRKLRQLRIQTQ